MGMVFNAKDIPQILIEPESYPGVKKIAGVVAEDINAVFGVKPNVFENLNSPSDNIIFAATVGKSKLLDELVASKKIDITGITNKREVFGLFTIEAPFTFAPSVKKALVIAGSDKRGTIYGLLELSERLGISPLIYWSDILPEKKYEFNFELENDCYISKEPSVKYRGLFINDEWPAFGNWSQEKFGDVNADCYEQVFLLLLRLKGNYMWPAMWNSSFSDDGPGIKNAELADMLGIVMGASHHEPMCRAGVEWQNIYKQYGADNTWSFISNRDAISAFWRDGIRRNKSFENIVTIGMRGENDSMLLGANATLADNIGVIKDAILEQKKILREELGEDYDKVHKMLAVYKEVEDYYYGNSETKGLMGWEELEDVILMLCEDNHGNMRGLPKNGETHSAGYGMYYHFDYHGGPISFEWQNVTNLNRTREQMVTAYEHGVRELWIVNVGDLKGNEFPLSYFCKLAYDYETYSKPAASENYIKNMLCSWFGSRVTAEQLDNMALFAHDFLMYNSLRYPETMRPDIYEPINYLEGDRVYEHVNALYKLGLNLQNELPEDVKLGFDSLFYYAGMASLNNILFNIEAGFNHYLAKKGLVFSKHYADMAKKHILDDQKWVDEFHGFNNGKWNHMMDSAHTNFASWDSYNWSYPQLMEVVPIHGAKVGFCFADSEVMWLGNHWQYTNPIVNDALTVADTDTVKAYIDLRGDVDAKYRIEIDKDWLSVSPSSAEIKLAEGGGSRIIFSADRSKLPEKDEALVKIFIEFTNGEKADLKLLLKAENYKVCATKKHIFVEKRQLISIPADKYAINHNCKVNGNEAGFEVLKNLGRFRSCIKAAPYNIDFNKLEDKPYVEYNFRAAATGEYTLRFSFMARNPVAKDEKIYATYSVNGEDVSEVTVIDKDYRTDHTSAEWCKNTLDKVKNIDKTVSLREGINTLRFYAGTPNVVLESIVLTPLKAPVKQSYLGPVASVETEE